MVFEGITHEKLVEIAGTVDEPRGWDFSKMWDAREPVPWDYEEVVRRYVRAPYHVLDIGTGGGEKFRALAPDFAQGVGIDTDAARLQVARDNRPQSLADHVWFEMMDARELLFPDGSFDLILNRHASVFPDEIVRVLRPGGVFITQQVGHKNTQNICQLYGCGPGGRYEQASAQRMASLVEAFQDHGCAILARAEHNVGYYFLDLESLVFWHKAIPIPEDFDIETHWPKVAQIVKEFSTARGIETNEHRELLIVQRRWSRASQEE